MFDLIKLRLIAYAIGAAAALSTIVFFIGHSHGAETCNTAHVSKANEADIDQLKANK